MAAGAEDKVTSKAALAGPAGIPQPGLSPGLSCAVSLAADPSSAADGTDELQQDMVTHGDVRSL